MNRQLREFLYQEASMTEKTLAEQYDSLLETIAVKNLPSVETLKTQNSDSLDFHDISVWCLKNALSEAFKAGFAIGQTTKPLSEI